MTGRSDLGRRDVQGPRCRRPPTSEVWDPNPRASRGSSRRTLLVKQLKRSRPAANHRWSTGCTGSGTTGAAVLPSPTDRATGAVDVRPVERHVAEHASFEAFQRERGGHHSRGHERGDHQCQHGCLLRVFGVLGDPVPSPQLPLLSVLRRMEVPGSPARPFCRRAISLPRRKWQVSLSVEQVITEGGLRAAVMYSRIGR